MTRPKRKPNLVQWSRISERMLLAFFLIVALVSAVRGYLELRHVQQLTAHGVAGEAVVLQCASRRGSSQVIYEYQAPDSSGTLQRYVAEARRPRCPEGEGLPILYLPGDPAQVLIRGEEPYQDVQPYLIVALGSLAMIAWMPLSRWWQRRRAVGQPADEPPLTEP